MTDNASAPARVEERLRAGDRRFSKLEQRIDASDAAVKALAAAGRKDRRHCGFGVPDPDEHTVDGRHVGGRRARSACVVPSCRCVALPCPARRWPDARVWHGRRDRLSLHATRPIPDWANAVVKLLLGDHDATNPFSSSADPARARDPWADPLSAAMALYAIDSPARQAAFRAVRARDGRIPVAPEIWGRRRRNARTSRRRRRQLSWAIRRPAMASGTEAAACYRSPVATTSA